MPEPLVSVVMASYNGAEFIAAAIDSVLAQTHRASELIVVDDCSSDGTADIVESYCRAEPDRVRLVRKTVREGPCKARNVALDLAQGSLIAWLDQDDVWRDDKLERQVRLLAESPSVGLVYSYFEAFDSDSGAAIPWSDGRRDFEGDVLSELFVLGCFIGSITALFRREALERRDVRLRDRDFSIGDDYFLWLTIALDWDVARIPEVLARYRRHGENESARMAGAINGDLWRAGLLREFVAKYPEAADRLGRARRTGVAWSLLRGAHYEVAARHPLRGAWLAARAVSQSPRTVVASRLGTRLPTLSAR